MNRRAISVTLDGDNLTWLKGRTGAAGIRSVSELLNQIVTAARQQGTGAARSVAATIDIDAADPRLDRADAAVRAIFGESIGRPFLAKETPAARPRRSKVARRRG
jgi:hypothetical protein